MSTQVKEKKLDLATLIFIATGQVIGAGVVTVIGPAISATGNSAWLSYGAAVLLGFLTIIPYVFLSSALILKGGEYTIATSMLGKLVGGIYVSTYITQCLSLGLMGTSMGTYVNSLFPQLDVRVVAIVTVTFFFACNLCGVNMMAKVQKFLTYFLVFALIAFGVIGLLHVRAGFFSIANPEFMTNGLKGFFDAMVMLSYSTVGQYSIINFASDAENPKRDIPRSIIITTCVIAVVYMLVGIAATGVLPLETVAGKPLTLVAKELLPGPLFAVFIILGPIFALASTLNSSFTVRARPILRGAQDGWFPDMISRTNKHGAPIVIMGAIYVVGILPILLNFNIKTITNNVVLIGYISRLLLVAAAFLLPTRYKEAWEKSTMHIPNPVYYAIVTVGFVAQFWLIYLSARNLAPLIVIVTIVVILIGSIYAYFRNKSGKVHTDSVTDIA